MLRLACGIGVVVGLAGCFTEEPPPVASTTNDASGTTAPEDTTTSSPSTTSGVDTTASEGATESGEAGSGPAVCGDGVVSGDEDCDDGNTDPGDGCHSDCTDYRLVFLSSTPVMGALDGLSGADLMCRNDANAAGHEGEFLAWLSVAETSAADRMQHADVAYRRPDGVLVAENWDDLTDGMLAAPIEVTAMGGTVMASSVWTGTSATGEVSGPTCSGWTTVALDESGRGGGTLYADNQWTDVGTQLCSLPARLYCVQQ